MKSGIEDTISNGKVSTPAISSSSTGYTLTYNAPNGGWFFVNSPLCVGNSSWGSDLFRIGNYEKEEAKKWYANIFYCYRTTDNEVPKNGFKSLYKYGRVCVYERGPIEVEASIDPDMDLIDKAGYRYVGYSSMVSSMDKIKIATKCDNAGARPGKATVGWDYTRSAAVITFFVEPVKLTYGHKAVDFKGREQTLNVESLSKSEVEFPDFFNGTRCEIPVKSLNKFVWPGFILEQAITYEYKTKNKLWSRVYDENTTTLYDPSGSNNRLTVTEVVPSSYSKEQTGLAKDKEFYFYYNTPTVEIQHVNYDTNQLLVDDNGKPLEYLTQILHHWAYISSLMTDNVGIPHELKVNDLDSGIKTFSYQFPELDLVQVEIYEINRSGKEQYYATLYNKEEYKPKRDGCKVENYAGVFEKYYTDSLSNIITQIGKDSTFNTNKNWKLVFKYRPVERVYISFMDLKGNKIFIKNPDDPSKYMPEITDIIPKDTGYTHIVEKIGDFQAIGYTEDRKAYDKDYGNASPTTEGSSISVPGNDGNRYIVIYYSTEKYLTVEYRDTDENIIKEPDIFEIPDVGTVIDIPAVPLYEIKEYKYDKNDDGVFDTTTPLVEEDKQISVPSTGTNQHIIIYYNAKKGVRVDYRDISGDTPLPVPPEYETTKTIEIPEEGIVIEVPVVPGYEVRYYKKNEAYNGTDTTIPGNGTNITSSTSGIGIIPNGNNQYVIIYYEKVVEETTRLIIEYRENTPMGPSIKPTVVVEIPNGIETYVKVPEIPTYVPKYYVKNTDSTYNSISVAIVVVGNPMIGDQKIIIVYGKEEEEPEDPDKESDVKTPEDRKQRVILRANYLGEEEYNVEQAIPSSENLYVSGEIYEYRFITEMEKVSKQKTVNVKISQDYITDLDTLATRSVETDVLTIPISYQYYEILRAELYDLKAMELENDAIKYYNGYDYDTGALGKYEEGSASLFVEEKVPSIYFYEPEETVGTTDSYRICIKDNAGYKVTYSNGVFNIKLKDVAYVKPVVSEFKQKYEEEAAGIVEKCTFIKVQDLKIQMPGEEDVYILTGKQYNLPDKTTALDSTDYYIPYVSGRAPLHEFFVENDLYVQEQALNKMYTTKLTGDYRMVQQIVSGGVVSCNPKGAGAVMLDVDSIQVNPLNIYTPIVNKTSLILEDQNKKVIQLNRAERESYNGTSVNILNLDERFTIKIPNVGDHVDDYAGYGNNKTYNHGGLKAKERTEETRLAKKSEDVLLKAGEVETEENAIGPSFAEHKLVRFPYDVYLTNVDSTISEEPKLFKANEWYDLYEYVKPSVIEYEFIVPVWVEDAREYSGKDGIQVLVVAENCPEDVLKEAKNSAWMDIKENAKNERTEYILRKTFDTYISGRVYDLQIRDSDDPGYMGKVKPALNVEKLPIGQAGQIGGYTLGLKLGYRFYFDLKTKGIANETIDIVPKIYYVSSDGSIVRDDISLFYHTKANLYNKLSEKDLNINMVMTTTHGLVNNPGYTEETISAKKLVPERVFTTADNIGTIDGGLLLERAIQKLPYSNLAEFASKYGFNNVNTFVASALPSETINGKEENIKDATGHWYGEYYLPASTIVAPGRDATKQTAISNPITTGYLVVAFEEIKTKTVEKDYLGYDMPVEETQWEKENAHQTIVLPNGKTATIPTSGSAMAIYQIGLRANNDYETEGTH